MILHAVKSVDNIVDFSASVTSARLIHCPSVHKVQPARLEPHGKLMRYGGGISL